MFSVYFYPSNHPLQPPPNLQMSHVSYTDLSSMRGFQDSSPSNDHHQGTYNTLRLRQNGRHFPDDIFKCIFLTENIWISNTISLKFVPKGLIDNIPPLVQIMAWRRPDDKPLSESMVVRLPTHICVTRPQWVKWVSTSILVLVNNRYCMPL